MSCSHSITSCYAFVPLDASLLESLRSELIAFGVERKMEGLTLIATEGINATVCGSAQAIVDWKNYLREMFGEIVFKDSIAEETVFRRWSVKIKPEIVALKNPGVRPAGKHKHLTPEEWEETINTEDVVIVDARNSYEADIGKFKGAIDPGTGAFHQFPAFAKNAKLPKDKKILMYCTGGIRCEKAIIAMENEGYENVYQLEGGILGYLEKFPHAHFEGECFVFDHRVAVDQNLQPSRTYGLCPHCGHAGSVVITCTCGTSGHVCESCARDAAKRTCSKRCCNEVKKELVVG